MFGRSMEPSPLHQKLNNSLPCPVSKRWPIWMRSSSTLIQAMRHHQRHFLKTSAPSQQGVGVRSLLYNRSIQRFSRFGILNEWRSQKSVETKPQNEREASLKTP